MNFIFISDHPVTDRYTLPIDDFLSEYAKLVEAFRKDDEEIPSDLAATVFLSKDLRILRDYFVLGYAHHPILDMFGWIRPGGGISMDDNRYFEFMVKKV